MVYSWEKMAILDLLKEGVEASSISSIPFVGKPVRLDASDNNSIMILAPILQRGKSLIIKENNGD